MKRKYRYVLAVIFLLAYGGYVFFFAPILSERTAVRNMIIEDINLSQVPDGTYRGEFYHSFQYLVEVQVENSKITAIEVLNNRDGSHAKRAEGVIEKILEAQSVAVDGISGATTTSKSLLKAIENALLSAQGNDS